MDEKDFDFELAREFNRYKNAHMISICMSALVYDLELKVQEGLNIPSFLLKDKIEQSAMDIIRDSIREHKFDELYEQSWNRLQEVIPEQLR